MAPEVNVVSVPSVAEREVLLQEVVRLKELIANTQAESDTCRRVAETSSARLEQQLRSIEDEKSQLIVRLEANVELVGRLQRQRADELKVGLL